MNRKTIMDNGRYNLFEKIKNGYILDNLTNEEKGLVDRLALIGEIRKGLTEHNGRIYQTVSLSETGKKDLEREKLLRSRWKMFLYYLKSLVLDVICC